MNSFVTSRMMIPIKNGISLRIRNNQCPWTYEAFYNAWQIRDFKQMEQIMNEGLEVNKKYLIDHSLEQGDKQMYNFFIKK